MYEWSEMDLAIQDAIRQFVDTEIRPLREEFEFGDLPPYDTIRKLFKTFGIDAMAAESLAKQLAKERNGTGAATDAKPRSAMGGQEGMAVILVKELCRVCPGFVGGIGVESGPRREHDHVPRHAGAEGALAARSRDVREGGRLGAHRARVGFGRVRQHEDDGAPQR